MRKTIGLLAIALAFGAGGCGGGSPETNTDPTGDETATTGGETASSGETNEVAGPECPADMDPNVCLEEMVADTTIGGLALGGSLEDAVSAFGPADGEPTKPVMMEATGTWYSELAWESQGVMVSLEANEETGPLTVSGIGVRAPSTAKTSEGIGVGASAAEILAAYGIDPAGVGTDSDEVLIGSPYFGIVFALENDRVESFYFGTLAE